MPRSTRPTSVFPIAIRHLEVLRVEDVTPGLRRVTLTGEQLGAFTSVEGIALPEFTSTGFDDDLWLVFPYPGETETVLPTLKKDGGISFPKDPRPLSRIYTVRRYDAETRELDVEFVRHGVGVGTTWAYRAKEGDRIHVAGPAASLGLPACDWLLVIGDDTAIPAISRLLEELPEDARAQVFIEAADDKEAQDLRRPAGVEVTWLPRNDAPAGTATRLLDVVRAAPVLDGECHAWVAGEQSVVRDVRRFLVEEREMPKSKIDFTGYWRRGEVVTLDTDPEVPDPERNEEAGEKFHELSEILPPLAIREAIRLGIGDHISRGTKSAAALAQATSTNERAVGKFLRYLHAIELLEPVEGGYGLTEVGEFLTVDWVAAELEPDGAAGRREKAYLELGQALKNGIADYSSVYADLRQEDWFAKKLFDEAAEYAAYVAVPLAEVSTFDAAEHVVVHADSPGAVAAAIVARNPTARVTIAALPSYAALLEPDLATTVTDAAQRSRISIVEQSVFEASPVADRVVLSQVLAQYPDADAALILRKAAASVAEGGQVLLVESTFDTDDLDEHDAEADLLNLALYGTGVRTPDELDALVGSAGLTITAVEPVGWGRTLRIVAPR